ncbi:D-glycerate dehydrogenase, partial [bacterium M00.F.Ca.ET.222.01.1.1]
INTVRRLYQAETWLRAGKWVGEGPFALSPFSLRGRKVGLFGMGRIGQGIARRGAHGFGMKVLYHNRSQLPAATEAEVGATYVDLDTLLAQSDHLLLVLPYTPASHHLI